LHTRPPPGVLFGPLGPPGSLAPGNSCPLPGHRQSFFCLPDP